MYKSTQCISRGRISSSKIEENFYFSHFSQNDHVNSQCAKQLTVIFHVKINDLFANIQISINCVIMWDKTPNIVIHCSFF